MQCKGRILATCLSCLLTIVGCSGTSGDGNDGANTAVKLSGLIGYGDIEQTANTGQRLSSSPENQVVVLAIDAAGNSLATTTDRAGYFEFDKEVGIQPDTGYGLVFIDMSTLDIIATLTAGSDRAGMLTLSGDTELSEVVISPAVKLAAILGSVKVDGQLTNLSVVPAVTLDLDSDGEISQAEIMTTLVNTVVEGNIDSITAISAFTFLGQKNTWTISVDLEDDAFEGSACDWLDSGAMSYPDVCSDEIDDNDPEIAFLTDSGEITMLATSRVEGPGGQLVDAVKLLEMTYLNKPYPDPESEYVDLVDNSLLTDIGYASGKQADINSSASVFGSSAGQEGEYWTPYLDSVLGAAPTRPYQQTMGLLGWSEYSFADAEEGKLINGSKSKDSDSGTFVLEWGESYLPLNLPVNREFDFTETETNEVIDPLSGEEQIVVETVTSRVRVQLAQNSDGTTALLQERGDSGIMLPVFQIRFTDPEQGESSCSYIVARYGIEGDDVDDNCDDMSDWKQSFVDHRFGRVTNNGGNIVVTDLTPTEIIANDSGEVGLPVVEGELTAAAIDWLQYIYRYAKMLDYQFEPLQVADAADWGNTPEFWAWVESPETGSALSPSPVASATNAHILQMGESPGVITVKGVHYMSSAEGVQFYLDLKTGDELNSGEFSVLEKPVAIDAAVDTSAPTTEENTIDISATFPALPAFSEAGIWRKTWDSLEDPDGSGQKTYRSARLNVWVIMDVDANLSTTDDQYQFPVAGYRVIDPLSVN